MTRKNNDDSKNYTHGYVLFILTFCIGLLINVSANIIYETFLKDNAIAQYVILALTFSVFISLVYLYHTKFHEPLAKFLQQFE